MATDIYNELSEISKNRYGVDIRFPIHDALAILSGEEYELIGKVINDIPVNHVDLSSADITDELEIIESGMKGADVKQAIHDALYKIWKLKVSPIQVTTGLTGIDLTNYERPVPSQNYITGLTDDLETLADFLRDSGLFSRVIYDEVEDIKGISVVVNEKTLAAINFDAITEDNSGYYIMVFTYNDDGTIKNTMRYPEETADASTRTFLNPDSVMKTDNAVLISCNNDAICFARNSDGGISVSFGGGYEEYGGSVFSASRIRTFAINSTVSTSGGVGKSYPLTDTAALTALIAEGTSTCSYGAYAFTTGGVSDIDYIVDFGSRKLYVANSMLAIEI